MKIIIFSQRNVRKSTWQLLMKCHSITTEKLSLQNINFEGGNRESNYDLECKNKPYKFILWRNIKLLYIKVSILIFFYCLTILLYTFPCKKILLCFI